MPDILQCEFMESVVELRPHLAVGMVVCFFGELVRLRRKVIYLDWWYAIPLVTQPLDCVEDWPVRAREINRACVKCSDCVRARRAATPAAATQFQDAAGASA